MGFFQAVKSCFSRYATFSGRAPRSEYWYFLLFNMLVTVLILMVELAIEMEAIASTLYMLVTFLPGLAVSVRRLHDTGRSGWWVLLPLVPLIGSVLLLIWMVQAGTSGDNAHGSDPLSQPAAA